MKIAVFGSANAAAKSPLYKTSYELGRLLALHGHVVMTGGYCGTMEAVSRGAADAGGHTIGVTCQEIEAFRPGGANPLVKEIISTETLNQRMSILTRTGEAYIALPGGIGTLAELSLAYNLIAIAAIPARVLITVGEVWRSTFEAFFASQNGLVSSDTQKLLRFADDPAETVNLLDQLIKECE